MAGEELNTGLGNNDKPQSDPKPVEPTQPTVPSNTKPFPEPKVLEAHVDPKEKPKEGPVAFSFTNPQAVHQKQAQPAKGDVEQPRKDPTVDEVRAQIAREETAPDNAAYSDYYDNAEMLIDGWTTGLASFANWFAGDSAISSYEYPKATSDKLKRQLTKVLIKNKKMLPIEMVFGGTMIGATAPILLKMTSRRKDYLVKREADEIRNALKKEAEQGSKQENEERGPGRPAKGHSRRKNI